MINRRPIGSRHTCQVEILKHRRRVGAAALCDFTSMTIMRERTMEHRLMHMAASSQFRRRSCSPLEVHDLHTLWAAVSVGPFFLFQPMPHGVSNFRRRRG
jgi:hypothetical protein